MRSVNTGETSAKFAENKLGIRFRVFEVTIEVNVRLAFVIREQGSLLFTY